MTVTIAPPPLQVPSDFVLDKVKNAFFSGLLNTIYQLWNATYSIRFNAKVKTTDASVTPIIRTPVPNGKTVMINASIVARRTGGLAGADGDSAFYDLTGGYKNIGGVLTGIGTPSLFGGEDQVAWGVGFTISAQEAVVTVQGAANNDITWECTISTYEVGA